MAQTKKSAGGGSASCSTEQTGMIATPKPGGFRPSDDVLVTIFPQAQDIIGIHSFEGTRAALEAEGVIPCVINWPIGRDWCCWQSGLFNVNLRRQRPKAMKGPMSLWLKGDYWAVVWTLSKPPTHATRGRMLARARLLRETYADSLPGRRENKARWDAYFLAKNDSAFRAFKATLGVAKW